MGIFKVCQRTLCMMNMLIIKLVVWLGWLSCIASGQLELSEAVTGFVNFPEVGFSCIGNFAVFIATLTKGRLDLEMGTRDVLAIITGPKLEDIHQFGLTTCTRPSYEDASVVMLSYSTPNSSVRHFMKYISNAYKVQSILLQCLPLESAALVAEICNCNGTCRCVVFCTVAEVTVLLARRMPRTIKRLTETLCLLLSQDCLTNGCHGCNQGMLYVEGEILKEGDFKMEFLSPISEMLDIFPSYMQENSTCLCIPMRPAGNDDKWTELLITSFKYKHNEERGVSAMAAEAMENYISLDSMKTYMGRSGKLLREGIIVEYSTVYLLLPRLTEILINLLLIFWFKADGFSSSMVARKAIKGYVVGSKGNAFAANAFLTRALVKCKGSDTKVDSNDNDTQVCQVLTFRGPLLGLRTLSFAAGGVNLICSLFWVVFLAFERGAGTWYDILSTPPSLSRVAVIMAAIGISLSMDILHVWLCISDQREKPQKLCALLAVMLLEIACIASGSAVAKTWGIKAFGRWVYSAMHCLVWVKWGIGSYLLGEYSKSKSEYDWKSGVVVYCSAFFLNFILAGVRCTWKYSFIQ